MKELTCNLGKFSIQSVSFARPRISENIFQDTGAKLYNILRAKLILILSNIIILRLNYVAALFRLNNK